MHEAVYLFIYFLPLSVGAKAFLSDQKKNVGMEQNDPDTQYSLLLLCFLKNKRFSPLIPLRNSIQGADT